MTKGGASVDLMDGDARYVTNSNNEVEVL